MIQNATPNPVVIQVNEQGANLIKAVCDAALKQSGVGALQIVNTILSSMKGVNPPQKKVVEKILPPDSFDAAHADSCETLKKERK